MKTLDEVIKSIEVCSNGQGCENCPYAVYDEDGFEERLECEKQMEDALHYLRAFRDAKDTLEAEKDRYAEAVQNCELAENKYKKMEDELNDIRRDFIRQMKNEPLSWEQLKQMEGKPVFLEQYWYPMEDEIGVTEDEVDIDKYWAVIDNVQPKRIHFVGKKLNIGMTKSDLDPNKNGGWQAYRKER